MISVLKFRPWDVSTIELRPRDEDRTIYRDIDRFMEIANKSDAFTMLWDDDVLAIGGVLIYQSGFGEAWIVCDKKIIEHSMVALRAIKNMVDGLIAEHKLHRLQATVKIDWFRAQRFLSFLGFEWEGTLRKYGPDQSDYFMYSRVM